MAKKRHLSKQSVYYRQFQGGYSRIPAVALQALMEGYRLRLFRRNDIRVFAARWEAKALHGESRVSLYRILNCDSKQKGNRRLSQPQIEEALANLEHHLPKLAREIGSSAADRLKPVARRVLRHIARGGSTTAEGLFLLAYFSRRIPQRKPMQRLREHEHYARFRYSDFAAWTGIHRATQSRFMVRLLARGFLNTAAVHKQNENAYGQLFIDGPVLSLVRRHQAPRRANEGLHISRREKKSTHSVDIINTTRDETSTLRNKNPRTEIRKEKRLAIEGKSGWLTHHHDPEVRRIALRASQIATQLHSQAA